MSELRHLFPSWGFLLQILAIVHFFRRRPEGYWFFVIFFGGFLGASVYILAEMVPDLGLLRDTMQGFGRRSRIQKVETNILDNPSPANYEELGELYKDQGQYAKGREAFTHAIEARSDSIYTFYSRALCSLAMDDLPAAIPDPSGSSPATASSITTAPRDCWRTLTRAPAICSVPSPCSPKSRKSPPRPRRSTTTRAS